MTIGALELEGQRDLQHHVYMRSAVRDAETAECSFLGTPGIFPVAAWKYRFELSETISARWRWHILMRRTDISLRVCPVLLRGTLARDYRLISVRRSILVSPATPLRRLARALRTVAFSQDHMETIVEQDAIARYKVR